MKKILFLIPTLGGGGAERVLVNLVNNLDKQRYDITIRTLFNTDVNSNFLNNNIKFFKGKVKQFKGNTYLLKLFSPRFLYKFFIEDKYDIVVSYLEGPTARIISGCTDKNTKKVSWIHCEHESKKAFKHSFRSFAEAKKCYMCYDSTICVADSVKQNFLSFVNVDNCKVLYNTNETEKILSKAEESLDVTLSNEINIFSVGRLTYVKGYERLINIHKKLLDEGIKHHVYVLGTGEEYEKLSQIINKLGVEDTFHLLGFKSNPYKYVKKSDLFVCSSWREGFSTAVTEALILGIPVVSTCCSGAYEMLGYNNEYGIVTENSEEGLYQGLKHILEDEQILAFYTKQARIRGKEFSTKMTVDAVQEMFESL